MRAKQGCAGMMKECESDCVPRSPSVGRTAERSPEFAALGAVLMTLIAFASGCATSPLAEAREAIERGDYVAARAQLRAIRSDQLSASEFVELNDDLCLVDFMIGRPTVPFSSQRTTCAEAARLPGSKSGPLVARIDESLRRYYSDTVGAALRNRDVARAERAVLAYRSTPGADQRLVDTWSSSIWKLIDEQDVEAQTLPKRRIATATAQVKGTFRSERKMNERAFAEWIETTVKGAGEPHAVIARDRVVLWIAASELPLAARNLDTFTRVNDVLSARCGCLGRTDVAVVETRLPAFLVRLDVESRRSEVIVLPHAPIATAASVMAARIGE